MKSYGNIGTDKTLEKAFEKKKDPDEFCYMCLGYLAFITILLTILLA